MLKKIVVILFIMSGLFILCAEDDNKSLIRTTKSYNKIKQIIGKDGIDSLNEDGFPALHIACQEGRLDIVKLLLEKGVDVNEADKSGFSPLYVAVAYGQTEIVKYLIDQAKANIKFKDKRGFNLLHLCVIIPLNFYKKEIVQFLIDKGLDINEKAKMNQYTILHLAIINHQYFSHLRDDLKNIINDLIKLGADPNLKDAKGKTYLEYER